MRLRLCLKDMLLFLKSGEKDNFPDVSDEETVTDVGKVPIVPVIFSNI